MATTYTLLALRREVARRLGDYYGNPTGGTTASVPTTGGTNNIADTGRTESDKFFNDAYFVGKVGGGSPVYGRVSTYTASTGTFVLKANLSSSCTTSDNYELYKRWSPDEYLLALNAGIDTIRHLCKTEVTPDTSLTVVLNQTEYAIPAGFSTLYRVSIEDMSVTGVYAECSPEDWDIIPGNQKVILSPRIVSLQVLPVTGSSTSRHIKLEGSAYLSGTLAAETDTTTAPRSYLVPYACQYLLRQTSQGRSDHQGRPENIAIYEQEMQAALAMLPPPFHHANEQRVRVP